MEFKKLIRSRFADPLTAIDLSQRYVCHGSAMGRIAFYDMQNDVELVLFDSQPELIRGISHSSTGQDIYISIGDVSCQKLDAQTLRVKDNVLIVDDVDERQHKSNCERSYTLLHQQYNCVMTIHMQRGVDEGADNLAPINVSDLENDMLVPHSPEGLKFTQHHVPFDFDGEHLIYMEYGERGVRDIKMYKVSEQQVHQLLRFTKKDPIVSHVKLARNKSNQLKLVYVQGARTIKTYDVVEKNHHFVAVLPDSILAMHVRSNLLRPCDGMGQDQAADPEAQPQTTAELMISAVDDSENVFVVFANEETKTTNVRQINIKKIKQP